MKYWCWSESFNWSAVCTFSAILKVFQIDYNSLLSIQTVHIHTQSASLSGWYICECDGLKISQCLTRELIPAAIQEPTTRWCCRTRYDCSCYDQVHLESFLRCFLSYLVILNLLLGIVFINTYLEKRKYL